VFPADTEEGRTLAKDMDQFLATGAPVKIPMSYVQDLEIPEFIKKSLPEITKDGFFALGPAHNPKPLLMRFEFVNDLGEQFTLEYVHLEVIQAGQEEITLTNDEQPVPIKVRFIVCPNSPSWTTYLTFQSTPDMNVHQILMQFEMMRCLSRPYTGRFTNLEMGFSGTIHAAQPPLTFDASHQHALEVIRALDALQVKIGKLVFIPERELTAEEVQKTEELRCIFLTGKLERAWDGFTVTVASTPEALEDLKQWLDSAEKILTKPIHFEEVITLFGQEYPLGKTNPIYLEGKLANEQEVREMLATQEECQIKLKFVPNGDSTFVKEYVDWLPDAERTA